MFNNEFKFKQILWNKVKEKENKLKQDAKIHMKSQKKYDLSDALKVLDELHLAYTSAKISNIFQASLVVKIAKQLNMHDHVVNEIV